MAFSISIPRGERSFKDYSDKWVERKCICGKIYWARKRKLEKKRHLFCSVQCGNKVIHGTESCGMKMRKSALKRYFDGRSSSPFLDPIRGQELRDKIDRRKQLAATAKALRHHKIRDTKIELIVKSQLLELRLPFSQDTIISWGGHKFNPDFVVDMRIAIECLGDYWHCNPDKYKVPISRAQIKNIARDALRTAAYEASGYKLVFLWGSQITLEGFDVREFL